MSRLPITPCTNSSCPNWDSNASGGYCMSPQTECYRGNDILIVLGDAIDNGLDLLLLKNDEGNWELYVDEEF